MRISTFIPNTSIFTELLLTLKTIANVLAIRILQLSYHRAKFNTQESIKRYEKTLNTRLGNHYKKYLFSVRDDKKRHEKTLYTRLGTRYKN